MTPSERDVAEALAALERLARHGVITPEESLTAARLITGDPTFEFPPASPPPPPSTPGEPHAEPAHDASAAAPR